MRRAGWLAAVVAGAVACASPPPASRALRSPPAGQAGVMSTQAQAQPSPTEGSRPQPKLPEARGGQGSIRSPSGPPSFRPGSGSVPSPGTQPQGGDCRSPKTCDAYKLQTAKGFRPGPDGVARVPFWIYARPPLGSGLSPEDIEGAILAAVRVWEAASPAIRLQYRGRTDEYPRPGDGRVTLALGGAAIGTPGPDGYLEEGDINPWQVCGGVEGTSSRGACYWDPCPQADGACQPENLQRDGREIQGVITHEVGHVLGLDHAPIPAGQPCPLTMCPGPTDQGGEPTSYSRPRQTLGLGDVLGLRALYPCRCPLPPIYDP